ncbi:hypothetical protein ONE63_008172 [Megalurothrips usitatus]|uniref:Uncharacterized protein n=1 Tax=Megalurothrips usitatus TaxID=439358 RepID=A0AAV7XKC3_9NEOP|nr:hypothetical protein ONE63_008172 [Megalurothrips usitatus]
MAPPSGRAAPHVVGLDRVTLAALVASDVDLQSDAVNRGRQALDFRDFAETCEDSEIQDYVPFQPAQEPTPLDFLLHAGSIVNDRDYLQWQTALWLDAYCEMVRSDDILFWDQVPELQEAVRNRDVDETRDRLRKIQDHNKEPLRMCSRYEYLDFWPTVAIPEATFHSSMRCLKNLYLMSLRALKVQTKSEMGQRWAQIPEETTGQTILDVMVPPVDGVTSLDHMLRLLILDTKVSVVFPSSKKAPGPPPPPPGTPEADQEVIEILESESPICVDSRDTSPVGYINEYSRFAQEKQFWKHRIWKIRMPLWKPERQMHTELYKAVMTLYCWAQRHIGDHDEAVIRNGYTVEDPFEEPPQRLKKRKRQPWM